MNVSDGIGPFPAIRFPARVTVQMSEGVARSLWEEVEGKEVGVPKRTLSSVVDKVARRMNVSVEAHRLPDRSWAVSRVRSLVAYLQVRRLGFRVKEVERYLGKDETTISTMNNRVQQRLQQEGFREEIERLCQNV